MLTYDYKGWHLDGVSSGNFGSVSFIVFQFFQSFYRICIHDMIIYNNICTYLYCIYGTDQFFIVRNNIYIYPTYPSPRKSKRKIPIILFRHGVTLIALRAGCDHAKERTSIWNLCELGVSEVNSTLVSSKTE